MRSMVWGPQLPDGEVVQPVGRHIQYLNLNFPHGMTDRIRYYFHPLVALGRHLNATVHIAKGPSGPRYWLHPMHSFEIGADWGRYFDLKANGGNPWHDVENFRGCKTLTDAPQSIEAWEKVFDQGVQCVNIHFDVKYAMAGLLRNFAVRERVTMPVSPLVRTAAKDFLARYGVEASYGSCHLRRCDRLATTKQRTEPHKIYAEIAKNPDVHTWLFFMFAEEGYREKLRKILAPLGKKLLFEDEVVLSEQYPADNYFAYVLGKYLASRAEVVLETDAYSPETGPRVYRGAGDVQAQAGGIYLGREERLDGATAEEPSQYSQEEAFLEVEEAYEATCDERPKGARLLPPGSGAATPVGA